MFRDTLTASLAMLAGVSFAPGLRAQEGGSPAQVDAALPAHWVGPGPLHAVRASAEELLALPAGAVVRSVDHGAFVHARIDDRALGGAQGLRALGLDVRDEQDLIALNGLVLDGRDPGRLYATLDPAQLFTDPATLALPADAGLYVVQLDGPPRDPWLAEIEATGARIVHHVPMNAYVVRAEPAVVAGLAALVARGDFVQYVGAYEPPFRLHPDLRAALARFSNQPEPVTVQVIDGPGVRGVVDELRAVADVVESAFVVGPYVNVRARLHPVFFTAVAAHPRVFCVEPAGFPALRDEAQGQIVAGNVSGASPTGPGYLAWLAARGFGASQFGGFAVNVVDDATSLSGHPDLASGRIAFAQNPTGQSATQGGHGFLNAHIVAGLNSGAGSAVEDALGFNYGLGIAPWARVGATAIFGPGALNPTAYEAAAYGLGARISTNSWSFETAGGAPIADYDASAQAYDAMTRDAQPAVAGHQGYLVLFAAGNAGPSPNTVSTPSTAKNVLTVGASENVRQTGTDGCGVGNSGANDLNDVISFSSRGPVAASSGDGRWKPEIVAPGTHVQAGVPQSSYSGASVCNAFWPSGQTLYGWSSGTSHSTPAVAGGAALVYQWFANAGLGTPSPAMIKATLVASAEHLTGVGANDTLPSNAQGMGLLDLGRAFAGPPAMRVDQTQVLGATGATHVVTGTVADPAQPLRVTLVWTDAPGATSGAPWVNDLDLSVSVGGATYRGNVFSGASSVAGGASDVRNNTESVFRPAGTSGAFTVTVTAASIAGDGVPGNGDATDQDFALVIQNASAGGGAPAAAFSGAPLSGTAPLAVGFTDLSSGTITSRAWTFGDGGTSTATHPGHTYASAGSYTVSLTVTGPGGSDVETKTGYVTVGAPTAPGISDGSFEGQTAGLPPGPPWTAFLGTGHVISPSGVASDGGMPTAGTRWAELSAAGTSAATPPSSPGGFGTPPAGTAGVRQTFSYPAGQTALALDAAFLRNEAAGAPYNDFMSVDVSDGVTTRNLYYADTFTPTVGTSAKHGFAMTAVTHVAVDLAALFPSSTTATVFTLTAGVGNGTDGMQPSVGYLDAVTLSGSTPAPVAAFSATPTAGPAPLLVQFTDASSGSITGRSWSFGDGATSTATHPSHTYASPGTYTVTLTVTGPGGADVETKTNLIAATGGGGGSGLFYLSFSTATTVPGVGSVADEDVVTYDPAADAWALYFDGSDVGLSGTNVNAVDVRPGGALILSLDSATFSVPGLSGGPSGATVEDSDLFVFTPTSTGATTAGSFSFLLDGSDVGLTTSNEDVDAVDEGPGGEIYVSLLGDGSVTGVSAADEDVLRFAPTALGSSTAGSFALHFDGSDVGFSTSTSEDLDAIAIDAGTLFFSTIGSYSAAGGAGDNEDVSTFTGAFGSATSGSAALLLNLSLLGIAAGEDVDALAVAP